LFISPSSNETPQPASAVYAFNGLIASQFDGSSEAAILLLQEIARAQELGNRRIQESRTPQRSSEYSAPLRKLPPSPWLSLGGYFDYVHWADRERFMELDRAIAASQRNQVFELETDPSLL
jgi:hypothetical protein